MKEKQGLSLGLELVIWSRSRILPVRLTDFSITEEAFDPLLNPIRAKVSLGMRVLSVDDVGFSHKGGGLFMNGRPPAAGRMVPSCIDCRAALM